jgi:DNA-binding NarL/FixJ family response regulator
VAALGGQLSITSAPGMGTSVMALFPVEKDEAGRAEQPVISFGGLGEAPTIPQEHFSKTVKYADKRPPDRDSPVPARIILADGHDLIRQGLRNLLEAEPGFSIVGEATRQSETIELVEQLRPDVLIVDWAIGLNVATQVAQRLPQTHILVLSMSADEAYALEALRKGATGYALKTSSADELVHAVLDVAAGRRYLSPMLSERVIEFYVSERAEDRTLDAYATLTNREREIFQWVATGLSNAEIAERLTISPRTVETHRANMMHKLGLRTQSDLIRYAVRRGLISLED